MNDKARDERGFSILETVIVVLIISLAVAVATPAVTNAARAHRLSSAVRQVNDLIQRAKAQAMADNRSSAVVIDTAEGRLGLVFYDDAGVVTDTQYAPLPEGVTFDRPAGVTAPMNGAPTSKAVSFKPQQNSQKVFQQDFNSRGFPVVDSPTTVLALYLTNGESFRAITMSSVGGIRTWWWEDGSWVAARK
jgi:Tfp pilus assembly protein FimT